MCRRRGKTCNGKQQDNLRDKKKVPKTKWTNASTNFRIAIFFLTQHDLSITSLCQVNKIESTTAVWNGSECGSDREYAIEQTNESSDGAFATQHKLYFIYNNRANYFISHFMYLILRWWAFVFINTFRRWQYIRMLIIFCFFFLEIFCMHIGREAENRTTSFGIFSFLFYDSQHSFRLSHCIWLIFFICLPILSLIIVREKLSVHIIERMMMNEVHFC